MEIGLVPAENGEPTTVVKAPVASILKAETVEKPRFAT
jgi:hypothetical protein